MKKKINTKKINKNYLLCSKLIKKDYHFKIVNYLK